MSWANPLTGNPLSSRDDVSRAVNDLYEPLLPFIVDDSRVRLGSFGAVFETASAEFEGFARPLYGIVPMVAGGGTFDHWDKVRAGLIAGTDPNHPGYWGTVERDSDQRMVEQAAVGIALAFCPQHVWGPLTEPERDNLAEWLGGIATNQPVRNNWQFFRVLVSLGLERVGRPMDQAAIDTSIEILEGYRTGEHWYVDGDNGRVDYYIPMAFHTYGLMYVAANNLGLGDDAIAAAYRERARTFAADFAHWFGPDGAAVAMGRSLTYRFATASFWGALAWADVEPEMGWGAVRGMSLRHLRWWQDKAISDRDGVLSVGYGYDNRTLRESYNSAGSPYWAMKAFAGLGAPAGHGFWTLAEAAQPVGNAPHVIADAGWVTVTDDVQTVALIAPGGHDAPRPEQAAAKYRKFAYSSRYALSGEIADFAGRICTDSTLLVTDEEGNQHTRLAVEEAGISHVDGVDHVWSRWSPCRGVMIESTTWFEGEWHLRKHTITSDRVLKTVESGFALGCDAPGRINAENVSDDASVAIAKTWDGDSRIADLSDRTVAREAAVFALAVDANLVHPQVVVPVLRATVGVGVTELVCAVRAHPEPPAGDRSPYPG